MHIHKIAIKNYRKLKNCTLDISKEKTILVGANNSGKTSAMNALYTFLYEKKISTLDFTITSWVKLDELGKQWETSAYDPENADHIKSLNIENWDKYLPQLDIWFDVNDDELHHVCHMIPSLDWDSGKIAIRIRFEPEKIQDILNSYHEEYQEARKHIADGDLKIYPYSFRNYLDRGSRLKSNFKLKYYILDPNQDTDQPTPENDLEKDPLDKLIKINSIAAQRGFSDAAGKETGIESLSTQLQAYYKNILDPEQSPTAEDIAIISSIENANKSFEDTLSIRFKESIDEVSRMNYPGFQNPTISIKPSINITDSLKNSSSVRFSVNGLTDDEYTLSEKHNGLGYQNLISMSYKLIAFRDDWLKKGKKRATQTEQDKNKPNIEPIHLVLIEEPEAHLHVQVQQVFIRNAYEILTMKKSNHLSTQMVVSTHSSHIAHEVEFADLRYFKRESTDGIPTSSIVNLTGTFDGDEQTKKFVKRYIKTMHCDIFFADAFIIVEGSAERILLPYFIEKMKELSSAYLSILEMMGSHAHRLSPLIEKLGIITLVITDLDALSNKKENESSCKSSARPRISNNQTTSNASLKHWFGKENIDDLLELKDEEKVKGCVRVAFQSPVIIEGTTVIPSTFEDALAFSNIDYIKTIDKARGLMGKFKTILNETNYDIGAKTTELYEAIRNNSNKAEFAIDLLFLADEKLINTPDYIKDGLEWLTVQLNPANTQSTSTKDAL